MGFFDRFRKQKHNDEKIRSEIARIIEDGCAAAVEYAQDFDKTLDYSEESITALEEILDFYSKDIPESQPTENQIWSMALIFGSYLGETLLKNGLCYKSFGWGREASSAVPLLIAPDGSYLTPIDKVYKRLVNGAEDNVTSFYRGAQEHFGA